MHSMLLLPATILAFAAPHHPATSRHAGAHTRGVTAHEAFRATDSRIERKVHRRLLGGYRGITGCSAHALRPRDARPSKRYPRWRCRITIRGERFPRPCRAEAFVLGTHHMHVLRIHWLNVSRYCRN
jgi:hypothetical protein